MPSAEPLLLRVLMPLAHFRRGDAEGTILMFRQEIDSFAVNDNLVAGRCTGTALVAVWGRLFSPSDSPTRLWPVVVQDSVAARARFEQLLGAATPPGAPEPLLRMREGRATWRLAGQQLDAHNGDLLAPVEQPEGDPAYETGGSP